MKIEGELGGENAHVQQCNNIPDIFIDGLRYLCECYQKFQKHYNSHIETVAPKLLLFQLKTLHHCE